jgi:hypothetical protein
VELFHLEHYLCLVLKRHLRGNTLWDNSQRWFDGFGAVEAEYPSPGQLRIRATLTWVVGQEHWYYDPFEFELTLCPRTGTFRAYVFRFGDHRPLTEKSMNTAVDIPPKGGWGFEFSRNRVHSEK